MSFLHGQNLHSCHVMSKSAFNQDLAKSCMANKNCTY